MSDTQVLETWIIFMLVIAFLIKFALLYYYWTKRKHIQNRLEYIERTRLTRRNAQLERDREVAVLRANDLFRQLNDAPPSYQQTCSAAAATAGRTAATASVSGTPPQLQQRQQQLLPTDPPPDYNSISVIAPPQLPQLPVIANGRENGGNGSRLQAGNLTDDRRQQRHLTATITIA